MEGGGDDVDSHWQIGDEVDADCINRHADYLWCRIGKDAHNHPGEQFPYQHKQSRCHQHRLNSQVKELAHPLITSGSQIDTAKRLEGGTGSVVHCQKQICNVGDNAITGHSCYTALVHQLDIKQQNNQPCGTLCNQAGNTVLADAL